jgi:signal transduction histidine kinase/CheY-like chemotaxis protein
MYHESGLITLHVASDILIALAYFSIPVALIYFVRRRKDLAYNWIFILFALFIVLCGTTHIFGVISIWNAVYRLDGVIKALTAIASIGTAVILWRLMPHALVLPGIKEIINRRDELERLAAQRTTELTEVNNTLRKSEENLKIVAEKADLANQAKTDFLANISHELRTPLNVIVGISDILIRQEDLPAKSQKLVDVQQNSAQTLKSLINDLLDISKIESRNFSLNIESFNINTVLKDAVQAFTVESQDKDIELHFIPAKEDISLSGDPARIRQIITNLISNAIKFTHKGSITVKADIQHDEKPGEYHIEISVTDTGIGITTGHLDKIFDRFSQLNDSSTRQYSGAGLGLSISKEIARVMGGELTAVSEIEKGSVFTFTVDLPGSVEDTQTPKEQSKKTQADKNNNTSLDRPLVLAVDDYPANILVLENMLDEMGYDCITAHNGTEALSQISEHYDDIYAVLMDLQMPEIDGLEATRQIRKIEEETANKGHLPIIAITAHALQGTEEECIEAGMDLYLAKPYQREHLAELLKKCAKIG